MMICRLKIASVFVILVTRRTTSGPQNTALLVLKWELHCVVWDGQLIIDQVQTIVHRNWLPFEEQAEGCLSCVYVCFNVSLHKLGSFAKREIQLRKMPP